MSSLLDLVGLGIYDEQIKQYILQKYENALRFVEISDNTLKFYKNNPKGEDESPVFSIDLPAEYVLDQVKTKFVGNFAWSDTEYPGSTNPNLEGEPVLVLAVKGGTSATYSFINLKQLVDIYTGKTTNSATVSIDSATKEVSVSVKISSESGNILEAKSDGLYVPETDIDTITEEEILALF